MLKLMLVDDEANVRSHVLNGIDWNELGYEIVCEAENGKEAYDYFEIYSPDVVITDIKMPFMDGLELTEAILKKNPYTKIIILTGFDEFSYAKKGITLQIEDYILKPISKNELTNLLVKTKNKIEDEKNMRKNVDDLKEYYKKSYDLVRKNYLEVMLKGANEKDILSWIDYYSLSIRGELFCVIYVGIDNKDKDDFESSNLRNMAILRFLDEIRGKMMLGEYFMSENGIFIIQSFEGNNKSSFLKSLDLLCANIRQGALKFLDESLTIGVGTVVDSLDKIYISKESALNAYDYKMLLGSEKVIFYEDIESRSSKGEPIENIDLRKLATFIRTGRLDDFSAYLEKVYRRIIETGETGYMTNSIQIFSVLDRITGELGVEDLTINELKSKILYHISKQEPLDKIKTELISLAEKIVYTTSLKRKYVTKDLIGSVKDIVANELENPDLSIEIIAEKTHYSPNYLGSIFKKETGMSINAYILELRIEEAKELLINSSFKSTDIAMKTGFSSSTYFAFSFKKAVGISPREYRKLDRDKI